MKPLRNLLAKKQPVVASPRSAITPQNGAAKLVRTSCTVLRIALKNALKGMEYIWCPVSISNHSIEKKITSAYRIKTYILNFNCCAKINIFSKSQHPSTSKCHLSAEQIGRPGRAGSQCLLGKHRHWSIKGSHANIRMEKSTGS